MPKNASQRVTEENASPDDDPPPCEDCGVNGVTMPGLACDDCLGVAR